MENDGEPISIQIGNYMKKLFIAVLAAAAFAPAVATAGNHSITVSAGRTTHEIQVDGGGRLSENDTGSKIAYGYDFTPMWGIQAGYAMLGKGEFSDGFDTISGKPRAVYVAATGTFAMSQNFFLTAKAGLTHNRTKLSVNSDSVTFKETQPLIGVGMMYKINPNVALVAELETFSKVIDEDGFDVVTNMISVGARFSF
jgi:OOP family OmpA-OmpF porin